MKIKQKIEDFKVEELINFPKLNEGDYTYFWLEKWNWNTTRAIHQISKKCRVSINRFGWAGTKDKVGVTKQLVSAYKIDKETLENIKLKDIKIQVIGKGDTRINLGDLTGNRFRVIVRDLTVLNLNKLQKQFDFVKKNGFPNYFGEQRFGRGNTHLIGKEIIKGRIQRAVKLILTYQSEDEIRKYAEDNWGEWSKIIKKMPKWLSLEKAILNHLIKNPYDFTGAIRQLPKKTLKLYVHAYQSYLFNCILSKMISETGKYKKIKIRVKNFAFPLGKYKVPKQIEVPGYNTKLKKDRYSSILRSLLRKEDIQLEEFKCKRMPELKVEGVKRKTFVKATALKTRKVLEDELNPKKKKIELDFNLPKGSYATVLIRHLFLEEPK